MGKESKINVWSCPGISWCVSKRYLLVSPGVSATGQQQVSESLLGIRQERPHEDIKVVVDGPDERFRELRDVLVPRKRLPQMHRYVFREHICGAYASTRQHTSAYVSIRPHTSAHIYTSFEKVLVPRERLPQMHRYIFWKEKKRISAECTETH
jgi:hypothetical protein